MDKRIPENNSFLRTLSDQIHIFVRNNFPDDLVLVFQIAIKVLLLAVFIMILDLVLKGIVHLFKKYLKDKLHSPIIEALYKTKVLNAFAHVFSIGLGFAAIPSILYRHPKSFVMIDRVWQ